METSRQVRAFSALASAAIVAGVGVMLILGLRASWLPPAMQSLVAVTVSSHEEPKPRPTPPPQEQPRTNGAKRDAGAPAFKSQATQVVASPVPDILPPPPVVTAPVAGTGSAATQGAAPVNGPGIGAGGNGNGTGGGGNGGNGAGGVPSVGPKQIKGKLSAKDLPDDVLGPGQSARVGVRYNVEVDGHVANCRVTEPSGYPVADATTCRLIEQRFIYKPARDEQRRPVRSTIVEWHTWFSHDEG